MWFHCVVRSYNQRQLGSEVLLFIAVACCVLFVEVRVLRAA